MLTSGHLYMIYKMITESDAFETVKEKTGEALEKAVSFVGEKYNKSKDAQQKNEDESGK